MKNLNKSFMIVFCLGLIISFVYMVDITLGTEINKNDDEAIKSITLIISENIVYIPAKISKSSYANGVGIIFYLKDETRVILSGYHLITTTFEKYTQIRKELEAKNYIIIE